MRTTDHDRTIPALDLGILVSAAALSAISVAVWGAGSEALAVSLGGLLSFANWIAFRALLSGVLRPGSSPRRLGLAIALGAKLLVVAVLLYVLIVPLGVWPQGLAIGYGSLVTGLLGGSAFAQAGTAGSAVDGDA